MPLLPGIENRPGAAFVPRPRSRSPLRTACTSAFFRLRRCYARYLTSFHLRLVLSATHLEGAWWSDQPAGFRYRVYQGKNWITQEPWGGYVRHNTIHRQVRDARGELVADDQVAVNHALMMYPPMPEE